LERGVKNACKKIFFQYIRNIVYVDFCMVFNMKSIFSKSFIVSILLAGSGAWAGGPQGEWFDNLEVSMPQMNPPQESFLFADEIDSWAEDDILFLPLPLVNVLSEPQQVLGPISPMSPMRAEWRKESLKIYINPRLLHYPSYEEEIVMPRVVYTAAFTEDSEGSPNTSKENRGPRKQFIWPSHLIEEIEKLRVEGKGCSEMMATIWPQLEPGQQDYFLNDSKGMKFRKSIDERKRNTIKYAKRAARKASSRHNVK